MNKAINLYHYTSLSALQSILKGSPEEVKEICLWATRYDCFDDEEEFLYGVDCVGRVLPEIEEEKKIPSERRLGHQFKREFIKDNGNILVPYVVSLTELYDNQYMWENYADNGNGIAIGFQFDSTAGYLLDQAGGAMIKPCFYNENIDSIKKIIEKGYIDAACEIVCLNPQLALGFLAEWPIAFMQIMAIMILEYLTPQFKHQKFASEKETRIILGSPKAKSQIHDLLVQPNIQKIATEIGRILGNNLNIEEVLRGVNNEKHRIKANGKPVFYREIFLNKKLLKEIYVCNPDTKLQVKDLLFQRGLTEVLIKELN